MEKPTESNVIHRELDTEGESPGLQVVAVVAEMEGKRTTELSNLYGCIDGVLDHLFSNPPAPEADLEVSFNYEGYRITVEQRGSATLVKT